MYWQYPPGKNLTNKSISTSLVYLSINPGYRDFNWMMGSETTSCLRYSAAGMFPLFFSHGQIWIKMWLSPLDLSEMQLEWSLSDIITCWGLKCNIQVFPLIIQTSQSFLKTDDQRNVRHYESAQAHLLFAHGSSADRSVSVRVCKTSGYKADFQWDSSASNCKLS